MQKIILVVTLLNLGTNVQKCKYLFIFKLTCKNYTFKLSVNRHQLILNIEKTLSLQVTAKLVHGESNECSSVKATIEVCTRRYEQGLREAQFTAMRDYRLLLTNPALYKQEKTAKQVRL
jgi:hypothetical protein